MVVKMKAYSHDLRDKAIPFTGKISEITDYSHQSRFKECALKEIQEISTKRTK